MQVLVGQTYHSGEQKVLISDKEFTSLVAYSLPLCLLLLCRLCLCGSDCDKLEAAPEKEQDLVSIASATVKVGSQTVR